jgi:UDP-glucose 4-epimerase
MNVLVTGGTGYIGSHTCVELLAAGHNVTVVDDLSNSEASVVQAIGRIAGREPVFVHGRVQDRGLLDHVLAEHYVDAAIHFAAFKAVGESVARPLDYYENNLTSLWALLRALDHHGARRLVFSSSATVYGDPREVPIRESAPLSATNPYGQTKLIGEQVLRDLCRADPRWSVALLRYFNPAGAHPSGLIGENPRGIPNNLLPYVAQVAVGRREFLQVFGGDWPTPDGTGVRDYLHVVDLAMGHLHALDRAPANGLLTVNLGTGHGYSVLDVVRAFEKASGRPIPHRIVGRRPGDVASMYADPSLAHELLGWKATRGLEQMCADGWRWQQGLG